MRSPLQDFSITLPVDSSDGVGSPVIEGAEETEQAAVEFFLARAYSFRGRLLKFPCLPFQLDSALRSHANLSLFAPEVVEGQELIVYPDPLTREQEIFGKTS